MLQNFFLIGLAKKLKQNILVLVSNYISTIPFYIISCHRFFVSCVMDLTDFFKVTSYME